MTRSSSVSVRKVIGLGFLPNEALHGFRIDIPKGKSGSDMICITEHRGDELKGVGETSLDPLSPNDPSLRVVIDRIGWRWLRRFGMKPIVACGRMACW